MSTWLRLSENAMLFASNNSFASLHQGDTAAVLATMPEAALDAEVQGSLL